MNDVTVFLIYHTEREISEKSTFSVARLYGQLHEMLLNNGIKSIVIHSGKKDARQNNIYQVKLRPYSSIIQKIINLIGGTGKSAMLFEDKFSKKALQIIQKSGSGKNIFVIPLAGTMRFFVKNVNPKAIIYWLHIMPTARQQEDLIKIIQQPINLVTPSKALYKLIWDKFYENIIPIKFFFIPNSILYSLSTPKKLQGEVSPNSQRVIKFVHAGGTADNKGLHLMLPIFRDIGKLLPASIKVEFHYISAKNTQEEYNNINIFSYEKMNKNELLDFLADKHFGLMPSLWFENAPLLLHEYLEVGLFPIASNSGGIPEILEDCKYFLIDHPNSFFDWQRKIIEAIEMSEAVLQASRLHNLETHHKKFATNDKEVDEKWLKLLMQVSDFS